MSPRRWEKSLSTPRARLSDDAARASSASGACSPPTELEPRSRPVFVRERPHAVAVFTKRAGKNSDPARLMALRGELMRTLGRGSRSTRSCSLARLRVRKAVPRSALRRFLWRRVRRHRVDRAVAGRGRRRRERRTRTECAVLSFRRPWGVNGAAGTEEEEEVHRRGTRKTGT